MTQVAEASLFGLEVVAIVVVGFDLVVHASRHANSVLLELGDLAWIVGHKRYGRDSKVAEHVRGNAVSPLIVLETEREVCVDRVEPLLLKPIGSDLVAEADAPAFLSKIKNGADACFLNSLKREVELVSAIALQRMEHLPGQTFTVNAYENVLSPFHVARNHGHVLFVTVHLAVDDHVKRAEP